jgi:hypothetical protein
VVRGVLLVAAAVAFFLAAVPSSAQDRSVLVRALRHGRDFRVRVQAAFALGDTKDRSVRRPLERALASDSNPAVRAAAATALGKLGSRRAIRALRRASRDASGAVRMQAARSIRALEDVDEPSTRPHPRAAPGLRPDFHVAPREGRIAWPRIQYAVWVGDTTNKSGFAGHELATKMRGEIFRRLRLLRGVAVFDAGQTLSARTKRQLGRRRLPRLRLEGNLLKVQRRRQRRDLSVRCEVSILLLAEPQRNMRGMLQGAATGKAPRTPRKRQEQERRLAEKALEGAVRSAMANVPTALARASDR